MMKEQGKNINEIKTQLIADMNIGNVVESYKPTSTQGIKLKKTLVQWVNEGILNHVQNVSSVIAQCDGLKHVDENAFFLAETLSNKLNSTIKYHVMFCLEQLMSQRTNVIVENAISFLSDSLLLEDEQIKNNIRSGALNTAKTIPVIESLISACKIKTIEHSQTNIHEAYHPVSYVETVNENVFIRLGNSVLAINDKSVVNAKSPSSKFSFISTIVESMKWDNTSNSFAVDHSKWGKFIINEDFISRQKPGSEEIVESTSEELAQEFSLILEHASISSPNEAKYASQFIDSIIALHENYNSLALLDNCVIVENKLYNEKFAIIVNDNSAHFNVLKSTRFPNVNEKFTNVHEALARMEQRSGYDASHFFNKEISILEAKSKENLEKVNATNIIIESLKEKKREIETFILEEKKSAQPNVEKIKKLNESCIEIESIIIEQRNNLQTILAK